MKTANYYYFYPLVIRALAARGIEIKGDKPHELAVKKVAELEGVPAPARNERIAFLQKWLARQPNEASEKYEFKPLKRYDFMANIPPGRDYRQYPSLFGSKRVWRDGRTETV